MQFLIAEQQSAQYYFKVWIDTTKTLSDGSPDPIYVREYAWGLTPPMGQIVSEYLTSIKNEISLLAQTELSEMQSPPTTVLAVF